MFIERAIPQKQTGRPRRLIHGVGINDATYLTTYVDENGKEFRCPYYSRWRSLIQRIVCPKLHEKYPTYKDCTIEPTWLIFSNFKSWMQRQEWEGKTLDKDLLFQHNKHYGPNTCIFLPQALNKLLCLRNNARGEYPLGVSVFASQGKKYITAYCSFYAKTKNLGYFKTIEEAAQAYKSAKLNYIKELADQETNIKIKEALLRLF